MKAASARLARQFDDVTLLGFLVGITWVLISIAWTRRGGWGQLLWLCDLTTLGTAVGLLIRSPLVLTAQFTGMLVYHLAWHVDFLSYVVAGRMPFQATSYMFSGELNAYEKALSFSQHTFLVPICLWGLFRVGTSAWGWLLEAAKAALAFALTYLFSKPSENINWIFGAGFAGLSPAAANPSLYYWLMVTAPPLAIYLPTNYGAGLLCRRRLERPKRLPLTLVTLLLCAILGASLSGLVGRACEPAADFPARLVERQPGGFTNLERITVDSMSPTVTSIWYGLAGDPKQVERFVVTPPLPRFMATDGQAGSLLLRNLLPPEKFATSPPAPQEVVIDGKRGRKGTVVCAVVGADQFYPQPWCDLETALDKFQVHVRLGREGLLEFLTPGGNMRLPPGDNQVAAGGPLESLFVLTVVAFGRDTASRSPFFALRRTGVWSPDDVVWTSSDGQWTARLR